MIARLHEVDARVGHDVYEAVLLGQAAGPRAFREVLQRFGFADAGERITKNRLHQLESAKGNFPIHIDPVTKILTKFGLENSVPDFRCCRQAGLFVQPEVATKFLERLGTALSLFDTAEGSKETLGVSWGTEQVRDLHEAA